MVNNARTLFVLAGVAALGLVLGVVGGKTLASPPKAAAYSFDWPGQLVNYDGYGQLAYRDLVFTWGAWSGGYTWTYQASSYVAFGSPTQGHSFSAFLVRKSPQVMPTKWVVSGLDTTPFFVNFASSPQTPVANITSDGGGAFVVGFAMCKFSSECAPIMYGWYSQQLEGRVPQNSTDGYRWQSQFPYVTY